MSQHPEKASAGDPLVKRLLARLSDAYTWPVRTKAALIVALHALFVAGFESIYLLTGVERTDVAVLPVAISGWLFGVRGGLASAAVVSLLDVLVFDRLVGAAVNLRDLLNYAVLVLVGVVIGQLRGAIEQVRREAAERRVAEAAQREHQLRYQALFEQSNDAIFLLGMDGAVLEANARAHAMLGYDPGELVGQPSSVAVAERERAASLDTLTALQSSQTVPVFESAYRKQDGAEVPVEVSASAVWDAAGNQVYIQAIVRDITERKETEELLVKSWEFYLALMEDFPALVWRARTDMKCDYFNRTWTEFTGRPLDEELGVGWQDGIHADDREGYLTAYKTAFDARQPFTMEYRLRHHSGAYRWVINHGKPIFGIEGDFIAYIGACYDITERKRAEAHIQYQAHLLANVTDAIAAADADFTITAWNRAAETLYGWTAAEAIGQPGREFLQLDDKFFTDALRTLEQTGTMRVELMQHHRDGHPIHVESNSIVLRDADGKTTGFVSVIRDIGERKQAEALLAAEHNLLRAVIDNLPDYIFVKDREGRFILSNIAHAQGAGVENPDDLVGKLARDVYPPDVAEQFHEDDERVMASGEALISQERKTTDPSGRPRWVLTTKAPLRDAEGRVTGLVGLSRDITARRQAQELMRESEARYRRLFEDAPISLWEQDFSAVKNRLNRLRAEGVEDMRAYLDDHPEVVNECQALFKVIDANRASLPLYKASSKEELLGDLVPVVPAAETESQKGSLIAIAEGRTSFEFETVNLTLTGDPINVIVGWQVAPSYEDSYARVLVSIVDITALRRAQAASAQLAAIVESSSDAIIGVTLDGVISSWNPGAERLYGYSADEAIGRSGLILYPEDHIDDLAWILEQAARGEHITNFETVRIHKDGMPLDVSITVSPIRDSGGAVTGVSVIARDIRERKQREQALRASEERFRTITEASPFGIFLTDEVGNCVYCNAAYQSISGLAFHEALGSGWSSAIHIEDRDPVLAEWFQALEKHTAFESIFRFTHAGDGGTLWVGVQFVPVLAGETLVGYLGMVEDITSRLDAETRKLELTAEQERVNLMKHFIDDVSHDLRTPLTVIQSGLYLLEKSTDPERNRRRLAALIAEVSRMERILEDMLTLSWLDSGVDLPDRELCDLNPLIADVIDENEPVIDHKNHRVEADLAADLPPVYTNGDQMRRAISSLVTNALNYTPAGGHIRVASYVQDGWVVIEVQDNGSGINAQHLGHIFERFYRADPARSAATGGTGLGLSIARKIVETYGGRITVESTPGVGSTFRIWLPIGQPS